MKISSSFRVLPSHDKNKIILVSLHAQKFPFTGESHGICAISGYIKTHFPEISVEIYDLQITNISDLLKIIQEEKPVILGISAKLQTFDQMELLYKRMEFKIPKDQRPIIVMGNAIPNFNGQLILEKYFNDIIVAVGEGEIVIEDLIKYVRGDIRLEDVRNISYWNGEKIHVAIKDYLNGDLIPMPDRTNSLAFYNLGGEVYVETSRGCAYGNCTFCACSEFLGSKIKETKWRPRPINLVIEDLKRLESLGVRNVTFADEDFFGIGFDNVKRIKHFAEKIIENNISINIRLNAWVKSIFSNSDSEDVLEEKENTIKLLKQAGLVKIFMGLESGVESQLKRYLKGFTLNEFTQAFNLLKKYDIECEFGFILIDPLVTLNELKSSLNYLESNNFVHEITSIYKELRIQIGNSYIRQVRAKEQELNIQILDTFDFNTQGYRVIRYLHPEIQFFASYIRNWVDIIFKLYYLLRIFTRYTEQSKNNISSNRINRKICFDSISEIRELEFSVLKSFVKLIEQYGMDCIRAVNLLLLSEEKRTRIVNKLIVELNHDISLQETHELLKEAKLYLIASENFKNNLLVRNCL